MRKKRPITLLEIMIVILLIGIIGGVLGYNMKGSLDEGRRFRTKQGIARVHDLLLLEMAEKDLQIDDVIKNAKDIIQKNHLVKNPDELLKDGWGHELKISKSQDNDIDITSVGLIAFEKNEKKRDKKTVHNDEE